MLCVEEQTPTSSLHIILSIIYISKVVKTRKEKKKRKKENGMEE